MENSPLRRVWRGPEVVDGDGQVSACGISPARDFRIAAGCLDPVQPEVEPGDRPSVGRQPVRRLPFDVMFVRINMSITGGVRNTARETRLAAKAEADEVAAAIDHNDLSVRTKVDHHLRQATATGSEITAPNLKGLRASHRA